MLATGALGAPTVMKPPLFIAIDPEGFTTVNVTEYVPLDV